MRVVHRFRVSGPCYVDGKPHHYDCTVELEPRCAADAPRMELVMGEAQILADEAPTQEHLTTQLCRRLRAKRVTVRCQHGPAEIESISEAPAGGYPGRLKSEAEKRAHSKAMLMALRELPTWRPEQQETYRLARKKRIPVAEARRMALGLDAQPAP